MNILYLTDYEDIGNGGDSRVPWEMARYAARNTPNRIFLLTTGSSFSQEKDKICKSLTIIRVPSIKLFSTYRLFIADTLLIYHLYDILQSLNLTIIHSHSYSFFSFIVQVWSLNNNIPFIYTSHILPSKALSLGSNNYINKGLNILKIPLHVYLTYFYKGCSSIIALNKAAKEDWRKYSKYDYPIIIIPNAVNFSFSSSKNKYKNVAPSKYHIRLIFTGRITKTKNQEFLIKALQYLKTDKKITLTLPGEGVYLPKLKVMSEILYKDSNITIEFPGFISHDKIKKLLLKSTYFLSASLREVQSLSILEALASGTPVIGLENETTKELIKNSYNGYLLKKDSSKKQFANVLDQALNIEDKKYIEMCKNCTTSMQHLTWKNVWKKTENLYKTQVNTLQNTPIKKKRNLLKDISDIFNIKKYMKS